MPTARRNHASCVVNDKIYVIGGYNGSYLDSVEEYDPATDTWTTKTVMPTARSDHACAVVNSKIYVFGGYNGAYLDTVEEYNPATNSWATKTAMITARANLMAGAVSGKIFVIGGESGFAGMSTVEEYNPSDDSWTTKTSIPGGTSSAGIGVVGSNIYIIGGYSGRILDVVYEFKPKVIVLSNLLLSKWTIPQELISYARENNIGIIATHGTIFDEVFSIGFGKTNCHFILEEPPLQDETVSDHFKNGYQLLTISLIRAF